MSGTYETTGRTTIIRMPEDPELRAAILAKKEEYAQRIANKAGAYTHPENAAIQGLLQGTTFCFDMLARIELIDALTEAEEGVVLEDYADAFLDRHPMFKGQSPDSPYVDILRRQVIAEGTIILDYCTENYGDLVNGTGLQVPPAND
jgi:hypothetical protein